MWLVDTSVWIEIFGRERAVVIDRDIRLDEIVTCPPVVQEVLQGFADEHAYAIAHESLVAFPMVDGDLPLDRWLQAAQLYRAARRAGVTVRSTLDCLIAASAIRHGLGVLHVDRDFDELARVTALQTRRLRPAGAGADSRASARTATPARTPRAGRGGQRGGPRCR